MLYGNVATFDPAKEPGIVQAVVHYLREHGASLPDGRKDLHDISPGVYLVVREYEPTEASTRHMESHDKYADVQFVISGGEDIVIAPVEGLEVIESKMPDEDLRILADPDRGLIQTYRLKPGDFLIIGPEYAHKPQCFCGFPHCRKCVVKIPVSLFG